MKYISINAVNSRFLTFLTFLSASVVPLYLSMFRHTYSNVNLRLGDAFAVLSIVLTFVCYSEAKKYLISKKLIPIYLFCFYVMVQGFVMGKYFDATKEIVQILYITFYLSFSLYLANLNPRRYVKFFMICLFLSVLFTVLYHFSIGNFTRFKLAGEAKYAFGLLSVLMFLIFINNKNFLIGFGLIVAIGLMLLSLERKGMLGFILVVSLFCVYRFFSVHNYRRDQILYLLSFAIFIMGLLFVYFINSNYELWVYSESFIDEVETLYTSNYHRKSLLVNGITAFLERPFFGYGASNVTEVMYQFYKNPALANGTHNFYLDNAIRYGLVGCLILFSPLWFVMKDAVWDEGVNRLLLFFYVFLVLFFMAYGHLVFVFYIYLISSSKFVSEDNFKLMRAL